MSEATKTPASETKPETVTIPVEVPVEMMPWIRGCSNFRNMSHSEFIVLKLNERN